MALEHHMGQILQQNCTLWAHRHVVQSPACGQFWGFETFWPFTVLDTSRDRTQACSFVKGNNLQGQMTDLLFAWNEKFPRMFLVQAMNTAFSLLLPCGLCNLLSAQTQLRRAFV
jgi:hypothetical protein